MDQRISILLIEDDPDYVLLMNLYVNDACGDTLKYILESASSLLEGIDLLARKEFDIVLLDLMLPDSQGLETLAQLRQACSGNPGRRADQPQRGGRRPSSHQPGRAGLPDQEQGRSAAASARDRIRARTQPDFRADGEPRARLARRHRDHRPRRHGPLRDPAALALFKRPRSRFKAVFSSTLSRLRRRPNSSSRIPRANAPPKCASPTSSGKAIGRDWPRSAISPN